MKKFFFTLVIVISILPCIAFASGGFGGGSHGGGSFGGGGFGGSQKDCELTYEGLSALCVSVNADIANGVFSNPAWGTQSVSAQIELFGTSDPNEARYVIKVYYYNSNNSLVYQTYRTPSGGIYYAYAEYKTSTILKPLYDLLNFIKSKVDDIATIIANISGKVSNIYDSIGVKSSTYTLISDLHTVQQRTTTINTSCTSIKTTLISIDSSITTIDANISGIATAVATMNNSISGIASAVANMNNSFTLGGIHINTSASDPLYTFSLPDKLFSTPYSSYDGNTLPTIVIPYESGTALISDINADNQLIPLTHISNDGQSTSTRYLVSAYLDNNNYIRVYNRGSSVGSNVYNGFLCDETQRLYKVEPQSVGVDHWSDFVNMMSTMQTTLNNIHSRLGDVNSSLGTINTSLGTVNTSINNLLDYVDNRDFITTPRLVDWLSHYSSYLSRVLTTPFEKYFVKMFGSTWLFENIPTDRFIMPYLEDPWEGYNFEYPY